MPLDAATINMPEEPNPFAEHNTKASPIFFPVGQRKLGWLGKDNIYHGLDSHKALVRTNQESDGVHVLGVVGVGYKLIHNKELFSRVEDTMCKNFTPDTLAGVKIKDRVSGWGKMCFREYVFPNIKCDIGGPVKSPIAFRLIVQNGYGGSALRIHAGAIEFFCTNGMICGEFQSSYNKHTSGLEIVGIDRTIEKALLTFASEQQKWERWAETPVKHTAAMELFKQLANSDKLSENLSQQYMREQETRGANLWSVYSALTYYASHNDGDFKLRSTVEKQDSEAATMLLRELNVAKWVNSREWMQLEAA
jgi:hypothetical protein